MLTELCGELNNYFDRDMPFYTGDIAIEDGFIQAGTLAQIVKVGQYYRIIGSVFNDGVHKYTGEADEGLIDESFVGSVRLMAVPKEFIELAEEIKDWQDKFGAQVSSPFASESLSASSYSYSKASISADGTGSITWQGVFANKMSRWRKLRP